MFDDRASRRKKFYLRIVRLIASGREMGTVLLGLLIAIGVCIEPACSQAVDQAPLSQPDAVSETSWLFPKAKPLRMEGDLASRMIDGLDAFLLAETDAAQRKRAARWARSFEAPQTDAESMSVKREQLRKRLGMVEQPIPDPTFERAVHLGCLAAADGTSVRVSSVKWPVLSDPDPGRTIPSLWGEGLMIEPQDVTQVSANVILIPDCDQTPAEFCGFDLLDDDSPTIEISKRIEPLIRRRCRVLVPMLVDRRLDVRLGRSRLTGREWIYRAAYELGRHVIGYEAESVLAAAKSFGADRPLGVMGIGEGGRIAMVAAALDQRIDALSVAGCVGDSQRMWREPVDRNVFGWLTEFGDAELLSMVAPRPVLVCHGRVSAVVLDGKGGGAPGAISSISDAEGKSEVRRARKYVRQRRGLGQWNLSERFSDEPLIPAGNLAAFLDMLPTRGPRVSVTVKSDTDGNAQPGWRETLNEAAMQRRIQERMDRHNQLLLRESSFRRKEFFAGLKDESLDEFQSSVESYRRRFSEDVVGHFDSTLLPPNVRVRRTWTRDKWTGYEVVLDVYSGVIAYGVILIPRDLIQGEKRPVVVCQHGLEGRPTDTFLGDHRAYHDFAAKLAERGYITFAPQNPYLFGDRFRSLQRKANPLGKTLFSLIIAQHQQIVDWLQGLPMVDPDRIAFYGLSYGGKSAMRIPAVVTDYCLSICSADFNEWVVKNASTRHGFSYVGTGEYEIFEWNLGGTFNYAEMAALICPRPFMVERGHRDGVGRDEWVAFEYAKVRNLYASKLGIGDRTEIEWFEGPHTINGQGTFRFLDRHLRWGETTQK